jgi:hypothetical protein
MIINIVRSASPGHPARIRSWPPRIEFEMALPDGFEELPAHRMALAVAEANSRVGDLVTMNIGKDEEVRVTLGKSFEDGYREINVDPRAYRIASGSASVEYAEAELRDVFDNHPGARQDEEDFLSMVRRFADDSFYKNHLVAQEYILKTELHFDRPYGLTT